MNICYIFGSADCKIKKICRDDSDCFIAADGGYDLMKKYNIKPDILIGDFDSLNEIPENTETVRYPVRKDDTDLMLAVKHGFLKGFKKFIIFGCLGGRLDHTYATIQTANYIINNGGKVICVSNDECVSVTDNEMLFKEKKNGYISVFSLTDVSEGVCINNLSYPLSNAELTSGFPLGVSNEFTGKKSSVKTNKGKLLVIWNGNPDDVIDF